MVKQNKKGQTSILIFLALVLMLLWVIMIIVLGIVFKYIDNALDQDIQAGQVNIQDINAVTFGPFNDMVIRTADFWGICIIFGLVIGLFVSAYFTRGRFPKIGIIFDILLILAVFFISLYLSTAYTQIVTAFSSAGENFAADNLPKTSYFFQNLPIFIPIIGAIMMILFHSGIPRKQEEGRFVNDVVAG